MANLVLLETKFARFLGGEKLSPNRFKFKKGSYKKAIVAGIPFGFNFTPPEKFYLKLWFKIFGVE